MAARNLTLSVVCDRFHSLVSLWPDVVCTTSSSVYVCVTQRTMNETVLVEAVHVAWQLVTPSTRVVRRAARPTGLQHPAVWVSTRLTDRRTETMVSEESFHCAEQQTATEQHRETSPLPQLPHFVERRRRENSGRQRVGGLARRPAVDARGTHGGHVFAPLT